MLLSQVFSSFWPFWPSKWLNLLSYNTFKDHLKKIKAITDLHILSDPVTDFWKCPKKGFKKIFVGIFLIGSTQIQFKNLKFSMVVNWHNHLL